MCTNVFMTSLPGPFVQKGRKSEVFLEKFDFQNDQTLVTERRVDNDQ